ncbi:hypothetical protein [Murimonas intestini]|uniref:Lipoprotein n=1 Tax=Murimonas intestini TaxID=1337051 RepID=A0AB73SZC3_9FIRM|nr:hypothetical protein [Murimonas intestini]MCR1842795.1 hypothetical protein [Murimonas intestini]MCR1867866.1 hypothetical protein [Murimonas intestini]MCR1885217.1 hypothetical protein [Murimonas intestini]
MKKNLIISGILLCAVTICGCNSSTASSSNLSKVQDAISSYENVSVSEGIVKDCNILYVTLGENVKSEDLTVSVTKLATEDWFNYSYVMYNSCSEGVLSHTMVLKSDDIKSGAAQIGGHVWVDENNNLIQE